MNLAPGRDRIASPRATPMRIRDLPRRKCQYRMYRGLFLCPGWAMSATSRPVLGGNTTPQDAAEIGAGFDGINQCNGEDDWFRVIPNGYRTRSLTRNGRARWVAGRSPRPRATHSKSACFWTGSPGARRTCDGLCGGQCIRAPRHSPIQWP